MTARCSAWAPTSTSCAPPSGSSTGSSPQPSALTSRSRKSPKRWPRSPCRDPPRARCSRRSGWRESSASSPSSSASSWCRALRSRAIRPIGSRALNIARIEAGFLLPHLDFVSAAHTLHVGTERSPLELGLAWLVDFNKGHFTGRRSLLAEQRRGPRRQLVGLNVEGNKPAHNALLYSGRSGRKEAGSVTSAAWSPTCKRNLALAMLDAPYIALGSTVWAEIYLK